MSIACLSRLQIQDYRIPVFMGCLPEEQEKSQLVSFEVIILFEKALKACETDNLDDSYCYVKITDLIKQICDKQHYALIEHLAYKVFESLKKMLKSTDKLAVKLTKLKPPVENLKGGAAFCCYDKELGEIGGI